jgi:hypothetical protein
MKRRTHGHKRVRRETTKYPCNHDIRGGEKREEGGLSW